MKKIEYTARTKDVGLQEKTERHGGRVFKEEPWSESVSRPSTTSFLTCPLTPDQDEQHWPVDRRGGEVYLQQQRCERQPVPGAVLTPQTTINKSGFPSHLLLEEQVGWGTWLTITELARKINCETCTSRSSTSLSPSPSSSWSGRWAPAAPTSTPSPAGSLTPATSLTVSIMVLLVAGEDMLAVLLQVLLFSSPHQNDHHRDHN